MPNTAWQFRDMAAIAAAIVVTSAAIPAAADPVQFACDNGKPLSIDVEAAGGAKVGYDGKTFTLKKISGGVDGLNFMTGNVAVWSKETDLIITIDGSPLQCVQQ